MTTNMNNFWIIAPQVLKRELWWARGSGSDDNGGIDNQEHAGTNALLIIAPQDRACRSTPQRDVIVTGKSMRRRPRRSDSGITASVSVSEV